MQMKHLKMSNISVKIWMFFVACLLAISILFVITIANTASRVSVVPQLFMPDIMKFNHFMEVTNMQVPVKEKKLIEEMLVRFYVENRNEYIPNLYELSYRYGGNGPIARLSSPAVFGDFLAQIGNFTENLQEKGVTTNSIDITRLDRQDNTFTVDFDVYQFDGNRVILTESRRAVVKIVTGNPAYMRFSSDFSNPYGVFVDFYRETVLKKR